MVLGDRDSGHGQFGPDLLAMGRRLRAPGLRQALDEQHASTGGQFVVAEVGGPGGHPARGIQSTALLVLAARGEIDFTTFLFANVGDDSEHPATLAYIREVAEPYAVNAGLDLHQLRRTRRDGTTETLMERLTRPEIRSIPIPVRMANGAPGRRSCTSDFKIKVVGRWLRQHGASADSPAAVGIGISVDEIHRANRRRSEPHEQIEYPLLDLRLRREDCEQIITDAGLPVPPKSSCFFCPFRTVDAWRQQRQEDPELFAQAVALEKVVNGRRAALGRDAVYLTRYGRPLEEAVPAQRKTPPEEAEDSGCDSGWCMT
ncbi:phosphoadenosine phosphosulfate reductase [Kitasatospora purpeofusca]|uniref:phosphoadenosine phosphosulfate reductase n=1 Tax=Kitasatospora purpeofusca TaxID=67352 RepID=UPI0022548C5F|nr:phosphoadenosine phosphosulfate reductase [Kitasatospora purpeofusca]MCX4754313.1 phosphoadenosine phosphosulfate reductase [Kitasatospora purpeofusca]WSR33741.1 phosphoadenosine phosphosulfate reductase [Kitasatospora purpeofusca]